MARVIVEHRFDPPMTEEQEAAWGRRLDTCLEVRNGAWRRSAISKDRRRMTCEFEAPDAESVREALRSAAMPFVDVWACEVHAVEDYPEQKRKLDALLARKSA
jgi:hypothetical protein